MSNVRGVPGRIKRAGGSCTGPFLGIWLEDLDRPTDGRVSIYPSSGDDSLGRHNLTRSITAVLREIGDVANIEKGRASQVETATLLIGVWGNNLNGQLISQATGRCQKPLEIARFHPEIKFRPELEWYNPHAASIYNSARFRKRI